MIEDLEAFESALDRAEALLENPPAPGTTESRSFLALIQEIDRLRPTLIRSAPAADPLAARLADLDHGLADFRLRYPDHHAHDGHPTAFGPNFGFGKDLRGDG